jgi:hypothetical protein
MLKLLAAGLLAISVTLATAQDAAQPTLAAQMAEMLTRAGSGHSPTAEEIRMVEAMPGLTDVKAAQQLEPLMAKALANPDAAMRAYGLAMLMGMQTIPDAAPATATTPNGGKTDSSKANSLTAQPGPAAYKGEIAKALEPLIPQIGALLADDDPENRLLAANALGGFTQNPPPAFFTALLGFLKRDDAVGPVGLAVVGDLLQVGPISDDTANAIARYLHRSDQTPDAEANLVEEIASRPSQNKLVDKAVIAYLDADDASLRARVILSLPALDLSAETFSDTKAKVEGIAAGGQENPQVVSAAKAVAGCWVQVKMTAGCPVY